MATLLGSWGPSRLKPSRRASSRRPSTPSAPPPPGTGPAYSWRRRPAGRAREERSRRRVVTSIVVPIRHLMVVRFLFIDDDEPRSVRPLAPNRPSTSPSAALSLITPAFTSILTIRPSRLREHPARELDVTVPMPGPFNPTAGGGAALLAGAGGGDPRHHDGGASPTARRRLGRRAAQPSPGLSIIIIHVCVFRDAAASRPAGWVGSARSASPGRG